MSAVLVLSPGPAVPRWLRHALDGVELSNRIRRRGHQAIVVVNDHSAAVTALLRQALQLREPEQPLLVVTAVPPRADGVAALVQGLAPPGAEPALSEAQALAALRLERLPLRARVSAQAVSFEYEA